VSVLAGIAQITDSDFFGGLFGRDRPRTFRPLKTGANEHPNGPYPAYDNGQLLAQRHAANNDQPHSQDNHAGHR